MGSLNNHRQKAKIVSLAVALVLTLGLGFFIGYYVVYSGDDQTYRPIRIAEVGIPEGSLLYIAYAKGFFGAEGVNVSLSPFAAGRDALSGLVSGQAELATVANTPIVRNALEGKRFKVLATLGSSKVMGIMADKKTVPSPAALIGKRIGVPFDTAGEYFLDLLLARYSIPADKVVRVNIDPNGMLSALLQNRVHAAVTWNPYIAQIRQALGKGFVYFSGQEFYVLSWNLVASESFASDTRRSSAILRALDRAREYMEVSPEDSKSLVANALRVEQRLLEPYWADMEFDTTLDQSLILAMESQAKWYTKRERYRGQTVPNFLDYLSLDPLTQVSPEKVGVIR
ncbi:MAG: ABC transporter substrate-binding protein [Bdellovibrionota bacterium]